MTYVASHGGIFELIFANLLLKPIFAYSGIQLQDRSSSRSTRSTRNSQDAALFAASATDSLSASATSLHPAVSSSQPVAGSMLSPSPEFLAPVVQAVKASLPAEQAFISRLDPSGNSSVINQAIESSSSAMLGSIPSQNFSSQGFGHCGLQGLDFQHILPRPRYIHHKVGLSLLCRHFVRTFAPPNP